MKYKKNKYKNKNDVKQTKTKTEYIMFVDETDPGNGSEYFCLSGLIVTRSDYENIIIKNVNLLKKKHFNNNNIVFHYTEMKNNNGEFNILKEARVRNNFYVDFVNLLRNSNIAIISTYFDKAHMIKTYGKCAVSDYDVAFKTLLENYVHFLSKNFGDGMVVMESRLFNENANLQNTFYQYLNNGSELFPSETIRYHLKCLGFLVKNENCIGLQLADFIPATIIRIIKNSSDKYSIQKTIRSKVYYFDTDYEQILGIRNILGDKIINRDIDTWHFVKYNVL